MLSVSEQLNNPCVGVCTAALNAQALPLDCLACPLASLARVVRALPRLSCPGHPKTPLNQLDQVFS